MTKKKSDNKTVKGDKKVKKLACYYRNKSHISLEHRRQTPTQTHTHIRRHADTHRHTTVSLLHVFTQLSFFLHNNKTDYWLAKLTALLLLAKLAKT